jgi:uncharacterized protein
MDTPSLVALAERFGIRLVLLHGSAVSGRTHARSDADLAVWFRDANPRIEALADVAAELQRLHPGQDVDVAFINHADPLFLRRIVEHATLLYGAERDLQELRIYAFRRYQDHRRFLALERPYVRRALARLETP